MDQRIKELAEQVDIKDALPLKDLGNFIANAIKKEQKIHIVPQYRSDTIIQLGDLLKVNPSELGNFVSEELIKGIISLRSIKDDYEIAEIENWQPRVLAVGAVLGALVGLGAAYLLINVNKEEGPPKISAGEGVKLGVLVLGLLRSVANLGE